VAATLKNTFCIHEIINLDLEGITIDRLPPNLLLRRPSFPNTEDDASARVGLSYPPTILARADEAIA
jgi:hypothetical protein